VCLKAIAGAAEGTKAARRFRSFLRCHPAGSNIQPDAWSEVLRTFLQQGPGSGIPSALLMLPGVRQLSTAQLDDLLTCAACSDSWYSVAALASLPAAQHLSDASVQELMQQFNCLQDPSEQCSMPLAGAVCAALSAVLSLPPARERIRPEGLLDIIEYLPSSKAGDAALIDVITTLSSTLQLAAAEALVLRVLNCGAHELIMSHNQSSRAQAQQWLLPKCAAEQVECLLSGATHPQHWEMVNFALQTAPDKISTSTVSDLLRRLLQQRQLPLSLKVPTFRGLLSFPAAQQAIAADLSMMVQMVREHGPMELQQMLVQQFPAAADVLRSTCWHASSA
jgi:hypothetical protein